MTPAPHLRRPTIHWILGIAGAVVAAATWVAVSDRDPPAPGGLVVVAAAPGPAPAAAATAPPPAPVASPLLAPPVPPALPDVRAAAPDDFAGSWSAPDGAALRVARVAADRYSIAITAVGTDERYDGILRDGRIHFTRGIDGDWLQATIDAPCLRLGSGGRFCRAGGG